MGSRYPLYPFSLVWSPIPFITWIAPFIGHLGICSADGRIRDFQGPGMIGVDAFLFGRPTRFLRLDPCKAAAWRVQGEGAGSVGEAASEEGSGRASYENAQQWDSSLKATCNEYGLMDYNIMTRNCHQFVADFVNLIKYQGCDRWTMVMLAALMFLKGRYTGMGGFLLTWLPFVIIMVPGLYFGRFIFLGVWGGLVGSLICWFYVYSHFLIPRGSGDAS